MCVAVPGKIIAINGNYAKVDVLNNICEVNIKLVQVKLDDYVLVHAGFALEVLQPELAHEMIDIFDALGD
ncbi:MAG TPA: HypC/HybG/HupF family hydrogenase formation chaperone [Candidatus Avacidaminococcus intestinavium]|uniref:HypC/HybG/HupF family hydrogenase formation chaperone n=1 Tax=Candidatus Avacidaminococcus intestinavium TaxID=2840684 RepID=A0A9D1MRQ3_9FIRM|nr:HypC/HybG/HupF family hydrogenase formation chaperone [Candidatus Avacidaminococcus intestinavium]